MVTFRILHASDLHIYRRQKTFGLPDCLDALIAGQLSWSDLLENGDLVSSYEGNLTEALANFAYVNRDGLDAIVVSGDIATTGEVEDLTIARDFLTATPASGYHTADGKATLKAGGIPVALVPGNHDRFGPLEFVFRPGNTTFDAVFRDGGYWTAGQSAQVLWVGQRDKATAVLIAADFTLPPSDEGCAKWGRFGQGDVTLPTLTRLVELTTQVRTRYPGCVVLWMVHFDPEARDPNLTLCHSDLLKTTVTSQAPAAILCGHTHLVPVAKDLGSTQVLVSGTTAQFYAPHGNYLQIVEINVEPNLPPAITYVPYRYDSGAGFIRV